MNKSQCIKLINLYSSHPWLWNARNENYTNRVMRDDSWASISQEMNIPIPELKRKMESLSGSYRREKSRERKCRVTASGRVKIYKSRWFAYDAFAFMSYKNDPVETPEVFLSDRNENDPVETPEVFLSDRNENDPVETPDFFLSDRNGNDPGQILRGLLSDKNENDPGMTQTAVLSDRNENDPAETQKDFLSNRNESGETQKSLRDRKMAAVKSERASGQCRCCLNHGSHSRLNDTCQIGGLSREYRDVLLECFNLDMAMDTELTDLICDSCIRRLNDAFNFKTQVTESEQELLRQINTVNETAKKTTALEQLNLTEISLTKPVFVIVKSEELPSDVHLKEEPIELEEADDSFQNDEDIDNGTSTKSDVKLKEEKLHGTPSTCKQVNIPEKIVTHVKIISTEKLFVCPRCDKRCNNINSHLKTCNNLWTCKICNEKYITKQKLSEHERIHTAGKASRNTCGICCKEFPTRKKFSQHFQVVHGEKLLSCEVCEKKFLWKRDLRRHAIAHTDERPFACEICGQRVKTQANLNIHIKTHIGENQFICGICNEKFLTKVLLKSHIRAHIAEGPFACKICDEKFPLKLKLNEHVQTVHGEKLFACEVCKKKFSFKSVLRRHAITHTDERPFVCEICGQRARTQGALDKHIKTHIGENQLSCGICNEKFLTKLLLRSHVRAHTGERPFACKICDKKFPFKWKLNQHVRVVHGEKLFACDVCKKKFPDKRYLRRHITIHIDKSLVCEICGKNAKTQEILNKHIKLHRIGFACEVCKRVFPIKSKLRRHAIIHTDKRSESKNTSNIT